MNDNHIGNGITVDIVDDYNTHLYGNYYPGECERGAVVVSGFGSDQIGMKNIISEIREMGFYVFTFDFSGHGRSEGNLGLDNAQTDILAKQILIAKNLLIQQSGLDSSQICLVGHSMGARVIIQSQVMDSDPVDSIIVFGTQISLVSNIQSDLFTGTNDQDLDWVQMLNEVTPRSDLLLISGGWDDILPPSSAYALYNKLTEDAPSEPLSENLTRDLEIVPHVFHNYEVYSPACMEIARAWLINHFSLENIATKPQKTQIRVGLWLAFLISFASNLVLIEKFFSAKKKHTLESISSRDDSGMKILNPRQFLISKLLLWLPAVLVAGVLALFFMFLPLGLPVFNLIYVGFIGGYGILLVFVYRRGKMKGSSGEWNIDLRKQFEQDIALQKRSRLLSSLILGIVIMFIAALFMQTGLYYVIAPNQRLVWVLIFSPFTAIGFYIAQIESRWFVDIQNDRTHKWGLLLSLIGLVPFILSVLFFAAIGSFSGMLGAVQGLIILWDTILLGKALRAVDLPLILTAVLQALFLQILVIPQGVLFSPFI